MTKFSKRLYQAMKENKISQATLAAKTKITASSISDWLNEKYQPKQDKVYILAEALGVNPAWLMGFDDEEENIISINYENEKLAILFDKSKDLTEEELDSVLTIVKQIRKAKGLE